MNTLQLALRNLLRNRRRSLATLLAMAVGSASILLFGGFSANVDYELLTRHVRKGGHLQVQQRDFYLYGSGDPIAYGLADHGRILKAIRDDEVLSSLVRVATPTLQFGGIAGNSAAGVSRTIIGAGFVAEDINRMRDWNEFGLRTTAPPSALQGSAADAAVVGTGVARVLLMCEALKIANCPAVQKKSTASDAPSGDIRTKANGKAKAKANGKAHGKSNGKGNGKANGKSNGNGNGSGNGSALPADIAQLSLQEAQAAPAAGPRRIDVLVASARGAPNVASLEVIRAEDQGVKELDDVSIMLHLARLQTLIYGKLPPGATAIMLQLARTEQIEQARARLVTVLAGFSATQPLAVLDFRQLNPFYVQTMQMFDTIFGFVFVLIGGIVLFTVSNTMNTSVVERTVEIGTLRAMGLRRGGILRLFVAEGALLGCAGALLGAVLGLVLAAVVNQVAMPWLPPGNVELVPFTVRVWGESRLILGTLVGIVCIATVSAWWPAYRAARLDIVDALRHV